MGVAAGVARRNAVLRTELGLVHGGLGDRAGVVAALREGVLYVIRTGDGGVVCSVADGVTWVHGFTSRVEVARFAAARGEGAGPVEYASVRGGLLLTVARARVSGPVGVVIDAAGECPVLLPEQLWGGSG